MWRTGVSRFDRARIEGTDLDIDRRADGVESR
jgi:hypothetical protein